MTKIFKRQKNSTFYSSHNSLFKLLIIKVNVSLQMQTGGGGGLNEHCSFYSLEQSFTITKVLSQKNRRFCTMPSSCPRNRRHDVMFHNDVMTSCFMSPKYLPAGSNNNITSPPHLPLENTLISIPLIFLWYPFLMPEV